MMCEVFSISESLSLEFPLVFPPAKQVSRQCICLLELGFCFLSSCRFRHLYLCS